MEKSEWEDDWEKIEIPDLLKNENDAKRQKILEERKLMDEAEIGLADELFNETKPIISSQNSSIKQIQNIEKEKDRKLKQEQRRKEQENKQRMNSQIQREKREKQKRERELFGEAEVDEIYENYGYIADKY